MNARKKIAVFESNRYPPKDYLRLSAQYDCDFEIFDNLVRLGSPGRLGEFDAVVLEDGFDPEVSPEEFINGAHHLFKDLPIYAESASGRDGLQDVLLAV